MGDIVKRRLMVAKDKGQHVLTTDVQFKVVARCLPPSGPKRGTVTDVNQPPIDFARPLLDQLGDLFAGDMVALLPIADICENGTIGRKEPSNLVGVNR